MKSAVIFFTGLPFTAAREVCLHTGPKGRNAYLDLRGGIMFQVKTDEFFMESTEMNLMRHVHEQGFQADGCTWQLAKQRGDRAIRGMGSKKFAEAVQELVSLGYGEVKLEKPLTYSSLKELA